MDNKKNIQQIEAKRGEIEFRKKLSQQQLEGNKYFEHEYDAKAMSTILQSRMIKTKADIESLLADKFILSPYIEIGAERCQRTLVLENEIGVHGAAVDLSFDMLKSCDYYSKAYNKPISPLRICCDAYNLPFASGSIPFVFCYETLHHFPDPEPIVREIERVLTTGGCFFFDEEPYKKVLHVNLYKGSKIYSAKGLKRSFLKKAADFFFAKKVCNELEHGIIENEDIALKQWKSMLVPFKHKHIVLNSIRRFTVDLFNPSSPIVYFAAYLLGGDISGHCRKAGNYPEMLSPVDKTLICPDCHQQKIIFRVNGRVTIYYCSNCGKQYPVVDGVGFLFAHAKLQSLYPEIYSLIPVKES
jgi:SAM-dependent methyltransferase